MNSSKEEKEAAIVIKDVWGKIFSGLVLASLIGFSSFVFAQNAINAEAKSDRQALHTRGDGRDNRLDKMDIKIEDIQSNVSEISRQQAAMNAKLDILLRREPDHR